MEPLSPKSVITACVGSKALALLMTCLMFVADGCVTSDLLVRKDAPPPPAAVSTVVAAWNPSVVFPPDPVNRGEPLPGIAGRIYLFGPDLKLPVIGDGTMVVDLFSDMPGAGKLPLEEWRFDKDALKLLLKHDAVGWGYTLFLPWGGPNGTYRPEINRIHLRLRYERPNVLPLYSESSPMALQKPGEGIVRTTTLTSQKVMVPQSGNQTPVR
jgi:hypothetical protein